MGWAPMEPDLDTCGMTNWVGSFDPVMFIYFMLATVLIPYPTYVFVATVFNWEHRAKRPARHYQDVLHATSYGLILFIFGNYARTLNWITILAFWITWPSYSLIAELPFAKTSLASITSWPFGMYALFAGATAIVLVFAGYHIYLGIELNRAVPGFIGYACLKQQNNDGLGLSKVYNFMLKLQWTWSTRAARRAAERQRKLATVVNTIDPPQSVEADALSEQQQQQQQQVTGTVMIQMDSPLPSNHVSRMGSRDYLVTTDNNNINVSPSGDAAAAITEWSLTALETSEPVTVPVYQPYVWSAAVPGHFHPHHWQLFYTLAFFTRFDNWISRVGAGITLGCYMQGIMDLRPDTIYAHFTKEFPDFLDPAIVLRWLDSDNEWIQLRRDDPDLEAVLKQVIENNRSVHIQSGDASGVYEPAELATLMKRYEKVMDLFDHLSRTVVKLPPITNILIVTKPDPELTKLTKDLSLWLLETFPGIVLFVDKKLQDRSAFRYQEILEHNPSWKDRLQFWTWECHKSPSKQIHLAVTLGGDGTVLYTAWMFQHQAPPMVAFHLGSLGFLTNFNFDSYRPTITNIIRGEGMNLNIRMRLQCSVYKSKDVAAPSLNPSNIPWGTTEGSGAVHSDAVNGSADADDSEELLERTESHRRAEVIRKVKEMDSKRGTEVADLDICHENGRTLITRSPQPRLEDFMAPTDTWQWR
ncbi:NAD(+) kinase [Modicella reniformis]|uniref:NAD(+) kinase n=1 Tax=Modicella reniformis TaxID=1440133 RepID=A0A9P6LSP1_9FUNG|nr:NAD(+) kinase [Modicella reniformis]